MSILSVIRHLGLRLKALLLLSWPRPPWTALGTFAALVMSGLTLYLQFWPQHEVTATALQISAKSLSKGPSDEQQVSVDVAIWNRGNRPAVISSGYLLFDLCSDFRSAQRADLEDQMAPFVISPGEVVLKTLEVHTTLSFISGQTSTEYSNLINGKTESELFLGSRCSGARIPKTVYIGVGLEAVQSDGKLEDSSGLGGLLERLVPTAGLNLNDKFGAIGATAGSNQVVWFGIVPQFIAPIPVIPARQVLSTGE